MDYYNFGVEECWNGEWSRVKNGHFYNLQDDLYLLREVDIKSQSGKYYAVCCNHEYEMLVFKASTEKQPIPYVPEHARQLQNLKRGDAVWVQVNLMWQQVTFYSRTEDGLFFLIVKYTKTGRVFMDDMITTKEVFLKPPFDF